MFEKLPEVPVMNKNISFRSSAGFMARLEESTI